MSGDPVFNEMFQCTLINYFYNDMDSLHPMSFWHLVARFDMDIPPQHKCYGSAV